MAESSGPLAGIRVVEIAGLGPVPFAGMLLAELGAQVTRVERPRTAGEGGLLAASGGLTRSRASVTLDLKDAEDVAVLRRMVDEADVLVEGLRPGVMERLGLGPDVLRGRNPGLVYGRMTGWGQDGPLAHTAGHDITYAAVSGVLSLAGGPDKPTPPANLLADFGGGAMYLVTGVLAALVARARTGEGQVVDAAMVDGAASLATMVYGLHAEGLWSGPRGSNALDGGLPCYDTYRCADDGWVAVGALEPGFYAELLRGLEPVLAEGGDDTDLAALVGGQYDPSTFAAQRDLLTRAFALRPRDWWAEHFADTDACVAPVLDLTEAPRHPHLVARGVFVEVDGAMAPRVAPRFSGTPTGDPGRVHERGS